MLQDALAGFHPIVARWFVETLGEPSAPQRQGWPAIAGGSDTLILAPTGTGKTLAAFLWELNALITEGLEAPLANSVHLLYVSPLKALNNDVQRNLEGPLAQLRQRFDRFPDIRVAVRTGDTPSSARSKMLRTTPHILITTPESLHLLLTSVRGRTMFSALRAVIVDEIHAVAGSKRGAHLALTLERLSRVAPAPPQRIGLSATQKPLEEIARYLGGCDPSPTSATAYRPVTIVDCGLVKRMETRVVSPVPDLARVDGTVWTSVVPLVLNRIRSARTTLVFVNNRAQSEKIAAKVNALAEEELALPYHGSLSRERRLLLEERLKAGELRAVVTTSSLELGIDVGSVDQVVLLQSPKRVSAALQRVGRAGHSLDAVSRGIFVPTFRDDAMEQLAILEGMASGDVEPTRVVQNALDVRRDARDARGKVSERRCRRAGASRLVGSHQRRTDSGAIRPDVGHHLERHHSRPGPLHRQPCRPHAPRGAGRGIRARIPRRRRISARQLDVAHTIHRARSRHRCIGAGCIRAHALLARRVHGTLQPSHAARGSAAAPARRSADARGSARHPGALSGRRSHDTIARGVRAIAARTDRYRAG